ncbi:hypothetical protein EJ04DRAFT_510108 [Polyplosphaeria fusca]|uniref:dihydroneopterin aldolase n=1 Tax=Polyplosphaeria fusca TaxID=682080 RepID=A0A9P4V5X2_9PLEO|nr:hypothetical protein EJ04DRAFT_510108 [Polyplosphaeria fusca]
MDSPLPKLVRSAVLQAQLSLENFGDRITIRNLHTRVNAGVDVWGRPKEQRAHLTISIILNKPFDTAAAADSLDSSTVHYGFISKDISSAILHANAKWNSTNDLALTVLDAVAHTAKEASIAGTELDIFYPKGSMFGDGAGSSFCRFHSRTTLVSRTLHLSNIRIPCIIGLNSNERPKKQPVIVSLWIDCLPAHRVDDYVAVEECLVETVSDTSFGTLESLSIEVVKQLRAGFAQIWGDDAYIRLRIEKPLAVPSADAPVIEIVRPVKV